MEEEVSNNGGPWRARMNSRAPRQKEKKKNPAAQESRNEMKNWIPIVLIAIVMFRAFIFTIFIPLKVEN